MQYPDHYVQWVIHKETGEKRLIVANRFQKEFHKEIEGEKPFEHAKFLEKGKPQRIVINSVLAAAETVANTVKKAEEVKNLQKAVENEQKNDFESLSKQELFKISQEKGLNLPKRLTKVEILEKLKELEDNTVEKQSV